MSHSLWLCLIVLFLSAGCDPTSSHTASDAPLTSTASTQTRLAPRERVRTASADSREKMHTYSRIMMGMPFTMKIRSDRTAARVRRDAQSAFEMVGIVEDKMSEWKPESEVSRINRFAGANTVAVSAETYHVITFAKELSAQSNGAFDPTWAAFRGVWQFKKPPFQIPAPNQIAQAKKRVDYTAITLDPETKSVGLSRPNMELGLGAIAKGFAIDSAADALKTAGYKNFIIDGGGDVYLAGQNEQNNPWRVGIKHPRQTNGFIGYAAPENLAIVTSGDYEHHFMVNGKRYHHIIDVRHGYPANASVAVTVMAPKAMYADALATAIFILGPKAGLELVKAYENVKVLVLSPDGAIHGYPKAFAQSFPNQWK